MSQSINQKATINEVTICYDDMGQGTIPIIFIHGFPFNKSSWQPQMDFFKNANRVIAYDIRGFGQSTQGNQTESIQLYADDLIMLMDKLNIKKAIACGLSMGGYILLNAMQRYPDRFHGLVLCDTQCIADLPEVKEKRMQTIKLINEGGIQQYAEASVENLFCGESLQTKNTVVDQIKDMIINTTPATITGTLMALANRQESCSNLNQIAVPVLILCGREDKITPLIQSEFMLKNIPDATLHSINNAGHLSNLEQPDEFNHQLQLFISETTQKN